MVYAELNPFLVEAVQSIYYKESKNMTRAVLDTIVPPDMTITLRAVHILCHSDFGLFGWTPTPIVNNCYLKLCFVAQILQQNPTLADLLAFVTVILSYLTNPV